jgi:large subunit ribosomal protein L19e
MTNLKNQKRLASSILKAGRSRVWINPKRLEDIEAAITREEIKKLINEGTIKLLPIKGISRGRTRVLNEKKKKGRRRGLGSRKGAAHSKITKKEAWMIKIRSQRKHLLKMKNNKNITISSYRKLYSKAKSGRFDSISDLENYAKSHELWRKR